MAAPNHSRPQQESERRSTASGSQSRQPADPSLFQYKYTPSAAEAQPAYMPQLAIEAQGGSLGESSDAGGPTPQFLALKEQADERLQTALDMRNADNHAIRSAI